HRRGPRVRPHARRQRGGAQVTAPALATPAGLEVLISSLSGSEQRLLGAISSFTVGRDPACTIALQSKLISRKHITVILNGTSMLVRDSSRNGTLAGNQFLNNSEASMSLDVPLQLGEFTLRLRAPGAPSVPYDASRDTPVPDAEASEEPLNGPHSTGAQSREREIRQSTER